MLEPVYVIGAYTTPFGKMPDVSFKDLTRQTYLGVLADAGMSTGNAIESVWFGNAFMSNWGQSSIRGQVCFSPLVREGLFPERVPITNVDGACATGSLAFNGAWRDILSGQARVSLAIGIEKLYDPSQGAAAVLKSIAGGTDTFDPDETLASYKEAAAACGASFAPGPDRSVAMDMYAVQAKYHMWKYGTTTRQLAMSAAKNHNFGAQNPNAQYRFETTVEAVLEDRMVCEPLTRSMCSPIGDGGAAALLCAESVLDELPVDVREGAVKVAACALSGGKFRDFDEPSLSHVAAQKAYRIAGVGPKDIDVAEVHDATSFCEIFQVEMLGFCPFGAGGSFIEEGNTALEGTIPVNTSGGLVSKGHPIGATGLSMVYELVTQLRGGADSRQVTEPEFALLENGGGILGFEEAVCAVTILQRIH